MFKRKKDSAASQPEAAGSVRADLTTPTDAESDPKYQDPKYTAPKGRPTPSRKEQQAARRKPLVVEDRKAAKEAERQARREQQIREQQALKTGDEKNMPLKDRGKQRRYIRDYVDARFNIGDYMIIILLIFMVLGWILTAFQFELTLAMLSLIHI